MVFFIVRERVTNEIGSQFFSGLGCELRKRENLFYCNLYFPVDSEEPTTSVDIGQRAKPRQNPRLL